jgi:hypothetical protein
MPLLEELVVQLAEPELAEAEAGMQQALDALAPLSRLRSLESNFVAQGSALRLPAWPQLTKLCEAGLVPMAGDPKALPRELCGQLQVRGRRGHARARVQQRGAACRPCCRPLPGSGALLRGCP